MTFDEVINKICEELPEGYQITIDIENGYGGVRLLVPDSDAEIEGHQDEQSIEVAALELLEQAKQGTCLSED